MSYLSNAAEAMAAVARTVTDDQLANKTPCTEYDVRALVNHLLFWGPSLALPADLLAHLHDTVFAGVEQGREMGMYGPEVAVPACAPTLDRILGLTGRDPAWA